MKNTNLYAERLGLKLPWSVQSVALEVAEGKVEVEVTCAETVRASRFKALRMGDEDGSILKGQGSNAAAKGLNSRIQQLIQQICG